MDSIIRNYIERAIHDRIAKEHPGYSCAAAKRVFRATLQDFDDNDDGLMSHRPTLVRALELLYADYQRLISTIQRYQPPGSPPPGGPEILADWIFQSKGIAPALQVYCTDDNDYPPKGFMVWWSDGNETWLGGYDPERGWFAQSDEAVYGEDALDQTGRVVWCYKPDLEYLYTLQHKNDPQGDTHDQTTL